jgi:hypothetical protein
LEVKIRKCVEENTPSALTYSAVILGESFVEIRTGDELVTRILVLDPPLWASLVVTRHLRAYKRKEEGYDPTLPHCKHKNKTTKRTKAQI